MSSKADKQLERMMYLMEFKNTTPNKKNSGIEYHTVAADGFAYGIIKEGDTYYIKKAKAENKLIKESYDYLKGYNYRNEFGYKSYDKATKHLELQLMAINERFNKHEDISVVDFKKGEKDMSVLTEEARREINRVNQIFENSIKIGMNNTGDPESKGRATDPTKQGEPFEVEAKAELDKDLKATATVDGATPDYTEVKGVDADLTSDKMKKCNCKDGKCSHCDCEKAEVKLDGECIANKEVKGGKCVKMNESFEKPEDWEDTEFEGTFTDKDGSVYMPDDYEAPDTINTDVVFDTEIDTEEGNNELVGFEDDEEEYGDYASELEQTLNEFFDAPMSDSTDGSLEENTKTTQKQQLKALSEKIERMTNLVVEELCGKKETKKKKTIEEVITKMVNEEVQKLNDWGKHPRYQKPAFTTPENKEVIVNKGDKDWDDNSAKTSEPYGKKIGSSAPFDKVVDLLTDAIVQQLKEGKVLKKK